MRIKEFIERYKSYRKKKFIDLPLRYQFQYAFIGVGQHSISNLYPVIHHLGIPLKTICTTKEAHAHKMAQRFNGCSGTGRLEDILDDPAIKGVFVAANPASHFDLTGRLLAADKNVFVEKPPCLSIRELQTLISKQGIHNCQPGLQKRFSTINTLLKPFQSKARSYSYRYLTGQYPEGDPVFELFIHPVDNLVHLFGEVEAMHIHVSTKGLTYFLSITHKNGISGILHLSTDHSWKSPVDELEIITDSEILSASYPFKLFSIHKSPTIMHIPFDKIFKGPVVQKIYLDNKGFVPTDTNNSIAMQGFSGEIARFVQMTEGQQKDSLHDLTSLSETYKILEQIKAQKGQAG